MGSPSRSFGALLLVALLLASPIQAMPAPAMDEGADPGPIVPGPVAAHQLLPRPTDPVPVDGAPATGAPATSRLPPPSIVPAPVPAPPTSNAGTLFRSDPSHRAPAKILLVDDDASDGTNTTSTFNNSGHYSTDTAHLMSEALTALSLDHDVYLVSNGSEGPSFETLTNYSTVVWMTGYEWGLSPTLARADEFRLRSFMDAGGSLFLVGFGIFLDLYGNENHTSASDPLPAASLARAYLGVGEVLIHSGTPDPVNTTSSAVMTGSESYETRPFFDQYGDQASLTCTLLRPAPGALTVLQGDSVDYWGKAHDDEPRAVAYDNGVSRAVTFGLDVACIASATDRQDLVDKVMTWLGAPTLSLPDHSVMNWYIDVTDHHPILTDAFNTGFWTQDWDNRQFYQPIAATLHSHEWVTVTAHVENHGDTDETSVDVRLTLTTITGNPALSVTRGISLDSRMTGDVVFTIKVGRSGMYALGTEVILSSDVRTIDDNATVDVRVCEWLDDLENGTTEWKAEGDWSLDTDHHNTPSNSWYWSKRGTTNASGHMLYSPVVDLRHYNTSYDHPLAPTVEMIWLQFFFTGRMRGTGQDSIDLQFKASNMSKWSSLTKIDGNTPGADNVPGDFTDGWYHYIYGFHLGNYAGQTVQFRWVMIKRSAMSNSWWALDDLMVWMAEEANAPPEIVKKTPDVNGFEVEVATTVDLSVFARDDNDDILSYHWTENGVAREDWKTNSTMIIIPRNSAEEKYRRGNTLNVTLRVFDGTDHNTTWWEIHLKDPFPRVGDCILNISLNEDEPIDIDLDGCFYDIEGQDITVSSEGSPNISVTSKGENVLTFVNREPNWNGQEYVKLAVTDSAGSSIHPSVLVVVLPVNDAPRWKGLVLPDAEQDTYYSFNLSATDVEDDPLTYSDDCDLFDITASGQIAFVPRNEHVGDNIFNVTVKDPDGAMDVMELVLFVLNVNDPPVLLYIPPMTAYVDGVFELDVSLYVEDPDLLLPPEFRDRITYRDDTTKLKTNVETGVVTWTPTEDDLGDYFFTITVTDSKGRSDQQEILITVVSPYRPPEFRHIGRQVLRQDQLYTFTVPLLEPDPWDGDDGLVFTNDHTELFVIDADTGRISFTPENEHVGVWEVTITATDAMAASVSSLVVFEVVNENDRPRIDYIPMQMLKAGVHYWYQVDASDPDMEPRLVDGLPVDPGEALTFRSNSTLVQVDRLTGVISFTPTAADGWEGERLVKITVIDASSETMAINVVFAFTGENLPPGSVMIMGIGEGDTVFTLETYQLLAIAYDPDDDPGDLTYEWYANDEPIGNGPIIEWVPYRATATVLRVVVSDPAGERVEASLNIRVASINVPTPRIDPDLDGSTVKGDGLEVDLDFPEGSIDEPLDVIVESDVSGEVLRTSVTGDTTLDLSGLEAGRHVISITVTDGEEESVVYFVTTVEDDMHVSGVSMMYVGLIVLLAIVVAVYVGRKGWWTLEWGGDPGRSR